MQKPLKLAGVPQTDKPISADCRPKFTILWGHLEKTLLLNKFFPIVDMCLSCKDVARQRCTIERRWRLFGVFLRPAFSASRLEHVSDLHPKFALRPHHECLFTQCSRLFIQLDNHLCSLITTDGQPAVLYIHTFHL